MPTLTVPKSEVRTMLSRVMRDFHGPLVDAGVSVGLLAQWPSENADADEPCLKLHGYACAAVVKITPYRQRVQGIADAVVTLDAPAWERLSDAERAALLDHELTHLELARDDDGRVRADDAGRPKLRMRLHDWQLGGFAVVAARHGPAALESQMFRAAHQAYYQQVFSWSDDSAPGEPLGLGPGVTLTANGRPVSTKGELAAAFLPGRGSLAEDTFRALLSVGHTEAQARAAIDAVPDAGRYKTVSEMVDAVYRLFCGEREAAPGDDEPPAPGEVNAILDAHFGGDGAPKPGRKGKGAARG